MTNLSETRRKTIEIRDIHRKAMDLATMAMMEQRRGFIERAQSLFRNAFELEAQAANLVANDLDNEPTRSVLHRSAATLALDCNDTRAAERLAAQGLAGNPPETIADELRDVLDRAQFERHLRLNGIELEADEFQFSLDGNSIAPGMAQMNVFLDRVRDMERLLLRTAQRLLEQPFQERLRTPLQVYISAPRPASFAVSLKLGRPDQPALPGMEEMMYGFNTTVVNEVLTCFDMLNKGQDRELAVQFEKSDPVYYQNFLALSQKIAPDGEAVNFVGFTSMQNGDERRVRFTRPKQAIPVVPPDRTSTETGNGVPVDYRGWLCFADEIGENNKIKLVRSKEKSRVITVPSGMMSDIVKPLWGEYVLVRATRYNRTVILKSIEIIPVDEPDLPAQPSFER